jgi:hypothetical protein
VVALSAAISCTRRKEQEVSTEESVSFDRDIKPLFRERDRAMGRRPQARVPATPHVISNEPPRVQ